MESIDKNVAEYDRLHDPESHDFSGIAKSMNCQTCGSSWDNHITAIPWEVDVMGYLRGFNNENILERKANAAFIVRAVNSHEALIQACRHLLNDLEYRKIETAGMDYARRRIAEAEGK